MQTPAAFDANIDFIIERIKQFAAEGDVVDMFQANQRHHFLQSAQRMLTDWRTSKPCQITYHKTYAKAAELTGYLRALGKDVRKAFARFGDPEPDDDYLNPPKVPFGYLTDANGIVTYVTPQIGIYDRWPELRDLPAELQPKSRLNVGDHISGRKTSPPTEANDLYDPSISDEEIAYHEDFFGGEPDETREPAAAAAVATATNLLTTTSTPAVIAALSSRALLMSELLGMLLDELAQEAGGARTADRDVRPYVDFWIYILGDKPIADYKRTDARLFCEKITEIPHPKGMSSKTLIERYEHVLAHGWKGFRRITETTIENRYFPAIRRLYAWAAETDHFKGITPKLIVMGNQVHGALPKDAFTDAEIRALFGQPTFSGQQRNNSKEAGPFLKQDHTYWGYIIICLSGMRHGEIAQLNIDDIRDFEGILYFDLRPFDPEKGRVALADMRTFKSENAARLIPIDPLIIELGLLERARKLEVLGHTRLFPDWKWRVRSDGKVLHGDALTRDWQRRKADVTTRANVCAYSGRHSMASLLDALEMPQRDRDRVMGHSHPGVSGRYGRKGALPAKLVKAFLERDDPTLSWMRTHLVAARDRAEKDRKILEPWAIRPLDKHSGGR